MRYWRRLHTFGVREQSAVTANHQGPERAANQARFRGGFRVRHRQRRLVDRAEVAERLGVSKTTVRRLGRSGDLTEIRVSKRAVRIPEGDVDRHIAGHRIVRGEEGGTAA